VGTWLSNFCHSSSYPSAPSVQKWVSTKMEKVLRIEAEVEKKIAVWMKGFLDLF